MKQKNINSVVLIALLINIVTYAVNPHTLMHNAIQNNDKEEVEKLLTTYKMNPNALVSCKCKTPLHYAVSFKNRDMILYMLRTVFGSRQWINFKSSPESGGNTPLHSFIKLTDISDTDDYSIVQKFLECGADVNAQDEINGGTPLWNLTNKMIHGQEFPQIAQLLAMAGTDLSLRCKTKHNDEYCKNEGCTAYIRAQKSFQNNVAEMLKNIPKNLHERYDYTNDNVLKYFIYLRAIFYENYDVARPIIQLYKKDGKFKDLNDLEDDIIQRLVAIENSHQLALFLEEGFYFSGEMLKKIKLLIEKSWSFVWPSYTKMIVKFENFSQKQKNLNEAEIKTFWKEFDSQDVFYLQRSLAINNQVRYLENALVKGLLSDVLIRLASSDDIPVKQKKKRPLCQKLSSLCKKKRD